MAMNITSAATAGNPSSTTSGAKRRTLETVRRRERVEREGRTNRCR